MSAHTPGPWRLDVQGSYGDQVFANNGMIVADCKWTAETFERRCVNARLIAAAPDLLDALKLLYADPHSTTAAKAAIDAIAKAEGRP